MFELFAIEYLLEKCGPLVLPELLIWASEKGYPMPSGQQLREILLSSRFIAPEPPDSFRLCPTAEIEIDAARREFDVAKEGCIAAIVAWVHRETGRLSATDGIPMENLVEDYLCAVFSEIRMMANYFRSTQHLFSSAPNHFARFDYIIRRHLPESQQAYFNDWRRGFISGLHATCDAANLYIAAVFHNVLATYYLNRSAQASPYQIEKIRQREIVLDTNVLYSLLVPFQLIYPK